MPAVPFKLRTYTPEDFETLYAIDQVCYEPAVAYSRRELQNYLRFPGAECVIAEAAARPGNRRRSHSVGFVLTAREDDWGYIITMDVLAKHRRRGIASALLAEAERRLAAQGVREIELETAVNNQAAITFWKEHGYAAQGVVEGYYPGGVDAFRMHKSLPS